MLRSFNESVFRGPDTEGGGGDGEDVVDNGDVDSGGVDTDSDPDSGGETEGTPEKPLTVREQLKKAIAETSEPAQVKPKKDARTGRFAKAEEAAPVEGKEEVKEGEQSAAPVASTIPAPEALSKEAKAEWDKTPATVQQAFIKREQDMANGVQELKQRYTLIDQAIAPHNDALRQMNATPADAVNRMFLWFKALAGKPADAFPALAQSMGIDWKQLTTPQEAGAPDQAAAQGTASGAAPEIPEPVKNYVSQLEQKLASLTNMVQQFDGRFGNVEQNLNTQNEARTRENLSIWSTGKPHFEEVRQDMAKLIETGVIPLKPDGQVDLDTAYERAIYFNPEVRAKVIAEQQQANTQVQQQSKEAATTAQQTQVNKARKAAVSIPASSAPGANSGAPAAKKKPGEKLSVRESLKAALAELRDQ